jgi:hypothetical protein
MGLAGFDPGNLFHVQGEDLKPIVLAAKQDIKRAICLSSPLQGTVFKGTPGPFLQQAIESKQ